MRDKLLALIFKLNKVWLKLRPRPTFELRPYQLGDELGIIKTFNTIYPNDKMTLEKWCWKYLNGPLSSKIIVAVNPKKEIVGHFGSLANKGKSADQEVVIRQNVDICLLSPYRNQKFIKRSLGVFMKNPNFLAWGFSNNEKLSLIYRDTANDPNNNKNTLVIKLPIFQKEIGTDRLGSTEQPDASHYAIETIIDDDTKQSVNQLWEIKSPEIHTSIVRNWEYLKWRIIDSPENQQFFLLKYQDKLVGYFTIKIKKQIIYITDLLILNKHVNRSSLTIIEKYCQTLGATQIIIMATDQLIVSILKTQNYSVVKRAYFGCYDYRNKITASDIYLTFSDADYYLGA
jgi:hypothetical protein